MEPENTPASAPVLQPAQVRSLSDEWERRIGRFGDVEVRGAIPGLSDIPLEDTEMRVDGSGRMTLKGHAAVFNRFSLDLGGFKERIAEGAFDNALARSPHTVLDIDHDFARILGSTKANTDNGRLELSTNPHGLRFFAYVVRDTSSGAIPSYAEDLRILMDAGVIAQASFMFTVERDEWLIDDNDNVTRTILEVGELLDVCVTCMGAYPQTDSQLVRTRALDYAVSHGRLPAPPAATTTNANYVVAASSANFSTTSNNIGWSGCFAYDTSGGNQDEPLPAGEDSRAQVLLHRAVELDQRARVAVARHVPRP